MGDAWGEEFVEGEGEVGPVKVADWPLSSFLSSSSEDEDVATSVLFTDSLTVLLPVRIFHLSLCFFNNVLFVTCRSRCCCLEYIDDKSVSTFEAAPFRSIETGGPERKLGGDFEREDLFILFRVRQAVGREFLGLVGGERRRERQLVVSARKEGG